MTLPDPTARDRQRDGRPHSRSMTMTQFRRTLAVQIEHVASGGLGVIVHRYGRPAAVLVSYEDYECMCELQDLEDWGPYEAKTGHRMGTALWKKMRQKFGISMFPPAKRHPFGPMMEDTAPGDAAQPGKWDRWK